MEKNVYQNELNQVRYTAEGKAALKTALLTQSAFHSPRRRCGWGRRSLAGVLAAVLLIGTATAVAAPLWEAYFGSLSANERDLMEELSGELPPPVTCGGTTMKPLAAFGADGVFYLMLEIQTPEGTMLPLLDGEDACYTLMDGKNLENRITLVNSNGLEEAEFLGYMIADDYLEDLDPDDNRIRMVVEIHADGTLVGKTLRIPGLWEINGEETVAIAEGEWLFPITESMSQELVWTLDAAGLTTETPYGPIVMDSLRISPVRVEYTYHYDEAVAEAAKEAERAIQEEDAVVGMVGEDGSTTPMAVSITPSAKLSLVMEDGSQMEFNGGFSSLGSGNRHQVSTTFAQPVALTEADYLLWGETRIPLT